MIESFDYNYRNPSVFLFLMLIRAKEKTKGMLVVVVK